MSRTLPIFAALALVVAACGPSSNSPVTQTDGGGLDRMAQHDGAQDGPQNDAPAQDDGPLQNDGPLQDDAATQQDAGPATPYADIRYLQQDPSLSGLAPLDSRVRIEGAVVTAFSSSVSAFFLQNATGPKEYSGIIVKKNANVPTDLVAGDTVTIEATLIEETRSCYDLDAGACPTRHALANVTLCTKGTAAAVPTPLDVVGADVLANTAKYDGVLIHLTDSTLTVAAGGTTATTTPLSNGLAAYGQYYSPPGLVPSGTAVTTCTGLLDLYNRLWEIYPRTNADLVFQDWPGDAGIQNDAQLDGAGQQDGSSTSDAAPCGTETIVISQIYGGGGNTGATYKNDFIELFNRGTQDVNVGAWSVQYASYNGTTWSVVPLTGKTIVVGKYLLIAASAGANGADLPTPDVTGGPDMSVYRGKVALVKNATALTGACPLPSANIVDFVGFNSAATCSEGSPAPAGASGVNTNAIIRKAAGCQDFNDNNYDFSVGTPAPRNSSTTAAPCGC